jgi:hypothetical protein
MRGILARLWAWLRGVTDDGFEFDPPKDHQGSPGDPDRSEPGDRSTYAGTTLDNWGDVDYSQYAGTPNTQRCDKLRVVSHASGVDMGERDDAGIHGCAGFLCGDRIRYQLQRNARNYANDRYDRLSTRAATRPGSMPHP